MNLGTLDVVILFAIVSLMLRKPPTDHRYRLQRLEDKLDLLLSHSGIKYEDKDLAFAIQLVAAGQDIEAIKWLRGRQGLELKEAKARVEELKAITIRTPRT